MAEATTANGEPLALDEVKAAVATMLKAALDPIAQNQKVIADTMAAEAKAKADAAKTDPAKADPAKGEAKPLTLEDVTKVVSETLGKTLADRDQQRQSAEARNAFVADKLRGIPAAYAAKLGADPAKWAAEEAAIRAEYQADLKAAGAKVADVSGGNPGGASGSSATQDSQVSALKAAGLTDGEASFAATLRVPGK